MLRITVELVPNGREEYARPLTTFYVGNDGTGTPEFGNYDVYTQDPRGQDKTNGRSSRPGHVCHLAEVPRHEGLGPMFKAMGEHLTEEHGMVRQPYRGPTNHA